MMDKTPPKTDSLIDALSKVNSPKDRNEILDQIINEDDEKNLVNAISKVADFPNGVARLVEAIVQNQEREGRVGALVWLLEKSTPVIKTPWLKFKLVKAVLESDNSRAIEKIATFDSVTEVPFLVKAIKERDVSEIDAKLEARLELIGEA